METKTISGSIFIRTTCFFPTRIDDNTINTKQTPDSFSSTIYGYFILQTNPTARYPIALLSYNSTSRKLGFEKNQLPVN